MGIPPPPVPVKKSHKLRTTLIVVGALWVIGAVANVVVNKGSAVSVSGETCSAPGLPKG